MLANSAGLGNWYEAWAVFVVYLGIPLFKGRPKSTYLKPLLDKILHHFDSMKGHS